MKKTSEKYRLDLMDWLKALLLAALSSALFILQESLANNSFPSWRDIGIASVSGAVAYLIKNYFTPAKTIVEDNKPSDNGNTA